MDEQQALSELTQLYRQVDAESARLSSVHAPRLQCRRGCSSCCVDDITVYEIEAKSIRSHHHALLDGGRPNPVGACAFLDDEGACRIYDRRPYVCRTQGLPLRWLEESPGGATAEMRDICPLNEEGDPLVDLDADDCWTLGPPESSLAQLQAASDGGAARRIPLRDLFR